MRKLKLGDFGSFQLPKAREKNSKNHQISILGFLFLAKRYRRMIKELYFLFGS
jgi:hypothetical protein